MAIFSAIGAAVASAFGLTGTFATVAGIGLSFAGTVVAGVVAAGLGYATAKASGLYDLPNIGTGANLGPAPGVKVQVAPSTDNKIGIPYGRNFMGGPITDAAISRDNQTMHYCITLGEAVEGATYTVNGIYKNAGEITFNGNTCVNIIEQDGKVNSDLEGDIRVNMYAHKSDDANTIFPTSGPGANYGAARIMPHWGVPNEYNMSGLLFAIVSIDYDAENGLTALPPMTFDVTCSVSNPGDVLIDYLNNDRYGAGLSNDLIDVNSITGAANTSLKGYSAEQVTYTNNVGANVTQDRYAINGYISTANDVATNINKICQASGTFFTFDTKQGKFKVIPNRPTASTFSLNDDNIVSKIAVTSTELYSVYNGIEVVYADQNRRDQTNSVVIETPIAERNPNEPENVVKYRLDLVNDNIRAEALGNIDLHQARNSMVVQLDTDFSGMQIDVGDVVDVTNEDFGFTAKEFRVMRTQEKIDEGGMITCGLTLLEYNDSVYVTSQQTETDEEGGNIDIPEIPPVIIPPPNIFSSIIPDVDTFTVSPSGGTGAVFTVFKDVVFANYRAVYNTTPGSGYSVGDTITVEGKYLRGQPGTHNLTFTIDNVDGSGGVLNPTGNVAGNAMVFDDKIFGNFTSKESIGNIAVGGQIEDKPADKTNLSNANTISDLITTRELDFTAGTGLEPGDYSFMSAGAPIAGLTANATANFSFVANVNIEYANGTVQNENFGASAVNNDTIPTIMEANKKIVIGPDPVAGNVTLQGLNTADTFGGQRGFFGMRYDMLRITKGDIF